MHSDDKDFTDDGLAEVYLWNFKGKQTDLDALSSSSLFELEIATSLSPEIVDAEKSSKNTDDKKPLERTGRVYTYTVPGGISSSKTGAVKASTT